MGFFVVVVVVVDVVGNRATKTQSVGRVIRLSIKKYLDFVYLGEIQMGFIATVLRKVLKSSHQSKGY